SCTLRPPPPPPLFPYTTLFRSPPCSYVGHPLTEQIGQLRPNADEQKRRDDPPPVLLVLPGSRRSEIRHHMTTFGVTLSRLQAAGDRKSTRLNSSHDQISYAVFC